MQLNKTRHPNGVISITYSINNQLLSDDSLLNIVQLYFNQLPPQRKYFVLLRFKFEDDGRMVTLHKGIVLSKYLKDKYYEYCLAHLSLKSNDYLDSRFSTIIFDYFTIPIGKEKIYTYRWSELKSEPTPKLEKFGNSTITFFLPLNRYYLTWGKTILNMDGKLMIMTDKNLFDITNNKDGSSTIDIYKGKIKLCTIIDSKYNDNIFIRSLDNINYYIDFTTNKIVLKTKRIEKTKFITKIKKDLKKDPKIITIDIETIKNSLGVLTPYCYSMYDGKIKKSFFQESPEELFNALLRRKYRGYTVYAHNLSNFDLIFLFKYLAKLWMFDGYKVKPIFKEGAAISILISNDKGVSLTFRDSFLILPFSLKKLAETFKTNKKLIEPVLLDVNLKDEHKKYAQNDYSHYSKDVLIVKDFSKWKKLIIKYCENDCIVLYQILMEKRKLVYNEWSLNIENYPTISSLSYAIFRSKYLVENTIPITSGKVFTWIKDSYTGGSTDMYIPNGKNVKVYDGTSLYPSQMKLNKFPVGAIYTFEGDVTILDKDKHYWIADSEVKTKRDLERPYLQIHHKINGSIRTVALNGKFEMKIHCCEYYNSLEDYEISIKNGYLFQADYIFKHFVDYLFKLRQSYPKDHPMNLVCKLIMNRLYGRFAMKPIISTQSFMSRKDFYKLTENKLYEIEDFLDLADLGFFVSYSDSSSNKDHQISIGIASAITAQSRVIMANILKKNKENWYC